MSGTSARYSASTSAVPSLEQSSTTMTSFGIGTARTRSSSVRTVATSLYTGTSTDRRGVGDHVARLSQGLRNATRADAPPDGYVVRRTPSACGFPFFGLWPGDEDDGGPGGDADEAVRALRDVEEHLLPVAVAHEAVALVGEEAVDDAHHAGASAACHAGVGEHLEARW